MIRLPAPVFAGGGPVSGFTAGRVVLLVVGVGGTRYAVVGRTLAVRTRVIAMGVSSVRVHDARTMATPTASAHTPVTSSNRYRRSLRTRRWTRVCMTASQPDRVLPVLVGHRPSGRGSSAGQRPVVPQEATSTLRGRGGLGPPGVGTDVTKRATRAPSAIERRVGRERQWVSTLPSART